MNTKTFTSFFFAAILFSVFGVSANFAQSSTPDGLIKDLYKTHDQDLKKDTDNILNGKTRKPLDKYFDKTLADLMWKDLTSNSDEVAVLDFDPFYNAQDFDIKNFSISAPKIVGSKASVVVKFTNSGRKDTLNYQLVKRGAVWKISDIKYTDGSSLLGYFKDANK